MYDETSIKKDDSILILVVDDDATIRHIVSKVFEPLYNIKSVESGAEALEFIEKSGVPDLIIMDQMMPDMSGIETLGHLKENEEFGDTPVVFLTSEDNQETELAVFRAGAMDFITKPFVPEIARERVKRIIDLKKLQNSVEEEIKYKTNKAVELNQKLLGFSKHIVKALVDIIEDAGIGKPGHAKRVSDYAADIAQRMGKSKAEIFEIALAAYLYDIGEIAVPDSVLFKPEALNAEEYELVKQHPQKGAEILSSVIEYPLLSKAALAHQEKYDGTGYPNGLKGEEIPEVARIIAVADAYDAMTSSRPYRAVFDQAAVAKEIEANKGTQFDPAIADVMLRIIEDDIAFTKKEN